MTRKQIDVFLAVADHRSFSKGSEAVLLAQSTASQHIRALEEELGVRLFDRSAQQVSLTEVGRLFYEQARRVAAQFDEAIRAVRRFQGLEQATLRVGASTIPAAFLIPDMLGRFGSRWPGICLDLHQGSTREALGMLSEDRVELAVVGGKPDREFACEEVAVDRIVLVTAPQESRQKPLTLEDLTEIPLVQREAGSGTRLAAESALSRVGVDPRTLKVVAHLGSSEAIRRAVLGGAGYSFISMLAVKSDIADGALHEVPLPGLTIRRSFYLTWKLGRSLSPAAEMFVATMKESVPEPSA